MIHTIFSLLTLQTRSISRFLLGQLGFTYIYSYKSVNIYPSIRAISRYIIKALINASICFFGFWYNSFSGIFLKRTRFVFRHHKRSTINKSKIFNPCPIILKQRKLCVKPFSLINNPNINSTNRNNRKLDINNSIYCVLFIDY